jgi:HEAT repeat protein
MRRWHDPGTLLEFCLAIGLGLGCALPAVGQSGDELVELVITLLGDKDKDVRALGLEQVRSEAKGEKATRRFAAELRNLPPDAQIGLLAALADRGDRAARLTVLEVISKSNDDAVAAAAIEALGPLGEAFDVPRLVQLLSSGPKTRRDAARKSLVRLTGEGVPAAIAGQLHESPPGLHVALIEIVASRRALDAVPNLLSAAVDADSSVRAAAMTALGQLAAPEHLPDMLQGVLRAQRGKERDAAERAVALVCNRIMEADKRAEPLLATMKALTGDERIALLPMLGRVGGPAALEEVEAAISDRGAARHDAGIRALCNWPEASIAPRLIVLAQMDEHADHRSLARAALIRVAPLPDKRPPGDKLKLLQQVLAICQRDAEQDQALRRASAIRTVETLRFVIPYLDKPPHAQAACEAVVELAHHRGLREPNKAEFDRALDKVIATSKDAVVIERATRYKKGQTWTRPMAADGQQ